MPNPSRRIIFSAFSMLVVFFLALVLGYRANSQVTGFQRLKPFVVYKHEAQYTENPKFPPSLFDSIYARRSDGSWAYYFITKAPDPNGSAAQVRSFMDFRALTDTVLEPFTRSAVVVHLSDKEARWERGRVTDCSAVPEARANPAEGSRVRMLSLDVARVAKREDGAAVENWVAPALDCYPIQETEIFPSGSRNTRSAYKIEMGEPSDAFFEMPPEYIQRSPQQLENEYKFKFGVAFWGEPAASNMQRRYEHGLAR
jgi:hypothetical protein